LPPHHPKSTMDFAFFGNNWISFLDLPANGLSGRYHRRRNRFYAENHSLGRQERELEQPEVVK